MRFLKTLERLWRRFPREPISVRAAALTYVSFFSLVPLLLVPVLLMQGWHRRTLHIRLQTFIREVLAPGIREQSVAYLDRHIYAASAKAFGIIGLLTLLLSAVSLFRNLDGAINEIWGIKRKRALGAQLLFYSFLTVVGPLVLGISIAASASLRQVLIGSNFPLARPLISAGAITVPITALTLLYWIAPNTSVHLKSAAIGGIAAGALWELAKSGYGAFAARAIRYNPIYGSLGALPLFLIWVYFSWCLVLFGAYLAYWVQTRSAEKPGAGPMFGRASQLGAAIAKHMACSQVRGSSPLGLRELADLTGAYASDVRQVLANLHRERVIIRIGKNRYRSARPLEELTLAHIVRAVADLEDELAIVTFQQPNETKEIFAKTEQCAWDVLSRTTWLDLAGDSTRKA